MVELEFILLLDQNPELSGDGRFVKDGDSVYNKTRHYKNLYLKSELFWLIIKNPLFES